RRQSRPIWPLSAPIFQSPPAGLSGTRRAGRLEEAPPGRPSPLRFFTSPLVHGSCWRISTRAAGPKIFSDTAKLVSCFRIAEPIESPKRAFTPVQTVDDCDSVKKFSILLATVAIIASGCSATRSLPELPQLDIERFQGEVKKAIAGEAAQAKANPRDAYRTLRLGMVLHAHDQFQAAAQCYSRAYALDPKRFDTLYCWGHALASIGDYGLAAQRLRQALAIRPESIPAQLKLGDVLRESGDTTQSADLYRRVLIEKPDNAS